MDLDQDFFLYQFKTEFCPFSKIEHDKYQCVYAHNWQDYKRPYFKNLKNVQCKNWKIELELIFYSEGCAKGFNCEFCHGWKELEYHPKNFK